MLLKKIALSFAIISVSSQISGMKSKDVMPESSSLIKVDYKNYYISCDKGSAEINIYKKYYPIEEPEKRTSNICMYKGKFFKFPGRASFKNGLVLCAQGTKIYLADIKMRTFNGDSYLKIMAEYDFAQKDIETEIQDIRITDKHVLCVTADLRTLEEECNWHFTLFSIPNLKKLYATTLPEGGIEELALGNEKFAIVFETEDALIHILSIQENSENFNIKHKELKLPWLTNQYIGKMKFIGQDDLIITFFGDRGEGIQSIKIINTDNGTISHNLLLPRNFNVSGISCSLHVAEKQIGLLVHRSDDNEDITKKVVWNNPYYSSCRDLQKIMHNDTDSHKLTDLIFEVEK